MIPTQEQQLHFSSHLFFILSDLLVDLPTFIRSLNIAALFTSSETHCVAGIRLGFARNGNVQMTVQPVNC
jgi:hypothetical protein